MCKLHAVDKHDKNHHLSITQTAKQEASGCLVFWGIVEILTATGVTFPLFPGAISHILDTPII